MRKLKISGSTWSAIALGLSIGCAGLSPVTAQSLADRQMHATHEGNLAQAAQRTDRACGTKLKTAFDWSTFDSAQLASNNPVSWCTAALDAMEAICSTPLGKQAVGAKIKALTCAGAATPSATLDSEGTVRFLFSLAPNQNKLMVRDYLEKNL
jgi:hypothetical protein